MTKNNDNWSTEMFMKAYDLSAEIETLEESHRLEMQKLLLRIFEVRDSLRSATEELGRKHSGGTKDNGLIRRFKLIDRQFGLALKESQVFPIESMGKEADPKIHHIVKTEERSDVQHGIIIEEKVPGYLLKTVILRRPQVVVAVNNNDNKCNF